MLRNLLLVILLFAPYELRSEQVLINPRPDEDLVIKVNDGGTVKEIARFKAASAQVDFPQGPASLTNVLPSGMVVPYMGTSAPTGWYMADGSCVADSAAPDLESAIASVTGECDSGGGAGSGFLLPDLRGEFPRGADDMGTAAGSRGIDGGRTVGSTQSDQNVSHSHTDGSLSGSFARSNFDHGHEMQYYIQGGSSGNVLSSNGDFSSALGRADHHGVGEGFYVRNHFFSGNQGVSVSGTTATDGGSEARPRNLAMNYIIKQ